MRQHKRLLQTFLAEQAKSYRKQNGLSQEAMSEQLNIATRSYSDLEHDRCCFSGVTLMMFLNLMTEADLLSFHRALHTLMKEEDSSHDRTP